MSRLALLLAALCAAGCLGPTAPDRVTLETAFDLAVGTTAQLPDGLRITFDRVAADSRCPMDALCITAGDATVVIHVRRGNAIPVSLALHTTTNGSQISYLDRTIGLRSLQPYPRSDRRIQSGDYVATLVVNAQ